MSTQFQAMTGHDIEYPWIELTASDWLAVSAVPGGLMRGDRDVYTSPAIAQRLIAERQQLLRCLVAVLKASSVAEEVALV